MVWLLDILYSHVERINVARKFMFHSNYNNLLDHRKF